MENYQEKARENFYRNRPYGIHIDYARKGFVLFNHYTNSLGKQETGSIEGLPLEKFEDVDAIPLNGKIIKNGNQTTDIYFYTDDSNPYKNMKLDMDALKQYNRFIYPLSLFLSPRQGIPSFRSYYNIKTVFSSYIIKSVSFQIHIF